MSLLDKAQKHDSRTEAAKPRTVRDESEVVELAVAWFESRISGVAAAKALGLNCVHSHGALAPALRRAIARGDVSLVINKRGRK